MMPRIPFRGPGATVLAVALLAAAAAPAATLFGLVDTGEIFASVDGGASWTVRAALPAFDAVGLVSVAAVTDLTMVGAAGTVFRSTDGGFGWQVVGSVPASDVVAITVRGGDGALVALTATGSVWTSGDAGATWRGEAALPASDCVDLTVAGDGSLCALTATGGVYASIDGGGSWAAAAALAISDGVAVCACGDALFVMSGAGDVYRSLDEGRSFDPVATLSQVGMHGLALTGSGMAAATREGEVAVSVDGIAWTWVGCINQVYVTALASDIALPVSVPPGATTLAAVLGNPYPNPGEAGATTYFPVRLTRGADVALSLYDARGRLVARRDPVRIEAAGDYALPWRPGVPAAGIYFVRLKTEGGGTATARWLAVR